MLERRFYKGELLVVYVCVFWYIYVYGGGRDGEQTWLTVWISSCCKSASVTDGRPLIAGLWRLGSHRRRKSLSVSLGGWEGEGWGRHKSLSPVCVDTETWVFSLGEGLSYFDSAVVSSTTPWELVSGTYSLHLMVLLLMTSLRNWVGKQCALMNGNEMKGSIKMTAQ